MLLHYLYRKKGYALTTANPKPNSNIKLNPNPKSNTKHNPNLSPSQIRRSQRLPKKFDI